MGSGGGSSSGNQTQTNTIRYAPYIENRHTTFLANVAESVAAVKNDSPFADYSDLDIDDAFFGAGIAITDFSALFTLHENLIQDLAPETLYTTVFDNTISGTTTKDLVTAEADLLNDDIETNALPRLVTGSRDINSVMSSTFVIAKANLESTRVKALSKFSAELKYRLLPVVTERWKTRLEWNKSVVMSYAELMKLYFSGKMDVTQMNYTFQAKNKLWPFTVLEHERAALGALQGATKGTSETSGESGSTAQKAIGGALSGIAAGAAIGGPAGAGIGAVIGGLGGLLL